MTHTTSEVLNLAADLIEERGWAKGSGWFPRPNEDTPVCTEGALRLASDRAETQSVEALAEYLGLPARFPSAWDPSQLSHEIRYVWVWNDCAATSAEHVIEVLRATALIEAARESAAVRESVSA